MAVNTDLHLQNQVIYSVYVRAHTPEGTFRAVIPDLDRIKALGTDIIWLADLSAKDPFYITPIIMGVTMFVQQRLSPPATDPTQQKIMMFLPLIFTVLFLGFPSGLVVYWLGNNILSIAQQKMMAKKFKTLADGK